LLYSRRILSRPIVNDLAHAQQRTSTIEVTPQTGDEQKREAGRAFNTGQTKRQDAQEREREKRQVAQ
jgi:hypothetical protein